MREAHARSAGGWHVEAARNWRVTQRPKQEIRVARRRVGWPVLAAGVVLAVVVGWVLRATLQAGAVASGAGAADSPI